MAFSYKSPLGNNGPKIRPFLAIFFTTIISILLIWQRDQRSVGKFRNAVLGNPGTASFLKQIIASLLGSLWVYAAGSIFNLTTRLRLANDQRRPSLQALNIWVAIASHRIDFSLPVAYMGLTAIVMIAGHSIGALWGGAITPIASMATFSPSSHRVPTLTIETPIFNVLPDWMSYEFLDPKDYTDFDDDAKYNCVTVNGDYGFISTCPVPSLQGLILNSAGSATSSKNQERQHSKNDNPQWAYIGRSYGMASSVNASTDSVQGLLSYSYIETGYLATSTCVRNSSAAFYLDEAPFNTVVTNNSNIDLQWTTTHGTLPDSQTEIEIPVLLNNNISYEGVLTWAASTGKNQSVVSIAALDLYSPFDKIQCNIDWTVTDFIITMDLIDLTIYVQPNQSHGPSPSNNFDENGYLVSNVMDSLGLLAQTAASPVYQMVAETLNDNWQTYNTTNGRSSTPAAAVEDSFEAMIDDILVAFGAAQVYYGGLSSGTPINQTQSANLTLTYTAVRIGQDQYIFATLAINIAILLIAAGELLRTRNWRAVSLLDYLDVKSVIIAASAGGGAIAEECHRRHGETSRWRGDKRSREAAGIQIRLESASVDESHGPVIRLAPTASDGAIDEKRDMENGQGVSDKSNVVVVEECYGSDIVQ